MKRRHLRFGEGFRVIPGNRHSQAAEMVIAPGDSEGGADNSHRGADQWLYVLSGSGTAVHVPPAYGRKGDPLPRGRR
jgi:mannose-6-phosphate isomerase-like protein (cupin superfamily)